MVVAGYPGATRKREGGLRTILDGAVGRRGTRVNTALPHRGPRSGRSLQRLAIDHPACDIAKDVGGHASH